MSCLPPCFRIASALIVPPFLIIASDMSNPCSNNQHGIKILLFTEISCLQVIYFVCISDPPDNEMQAMFEQFSQEKGRRGLNANEQLMRFNEQFPKFNIWCMFPIYFQPIF